jgi:hypothetical protein
MIILLFIAIIAIIVGLTHLSNKMNKIEISDEELDVDLNRLWLTHLAFINSQL